MDLQSTVQRLDFLEKTGFIFKAGGTFRLTVRGRDAVYNLKEWDLQVRRGEVLPYIEQMEISPGSVVADIGCGGGQTLMACLRYMPSVIYGFDRNSGALEMAEAFLESAPGETECRLIAADALNLPIGDRTCTHVISRVVIQKLDQEKSIIEMGRITRVGGFCFIHTTCAGYYIKRILTGLRSPLDMCISIFALLNGSFLLLTGRQYCIRLGSRRICEAYVSPYGLKRRLRDRGWNIISREVSRFLLLPASVKIIAQKR